MNDIKKYMMLIEHISREVINESEIDGIYYHGTEKDFDTWDIDAEKVNRGFNVAGIYFTPRYSEAREYGDKIIKVSLNLNKPFYFNKKNVISEEMANSVKELLLKYTSYREHWLETSIIPKFIEKGNFDNVLDEINGNIKRKILLSGGYDCFVDGLHVCVLNPSKDNILILDNL